MGNSLRPLATDIFWIPKAGNAAAEYEDAYFIGKWKAQLVPQAAPQAAPQPSRIGIAIADGATEGMLSRQWANLLVRRFVRLLPGPAELTDWVSATLHTWQKEKRNYLQQRERNNKPVQWYEEPGLEAGAFAALLGLVLTRSEGDHVESSLQSLNWNAVAVGDCFLVQVRDDACVCMFPFDESSALTNRPFLLSSNPLRNGDIAERFEFTKGEALRGDRFYLMTDALAGWFLRMWEQGAAPWRELDSFCRVSAPCDFANQIEELRAAREMRNDDVTLIRLELPEKF